MDMDGYIGENAHIIRTAVNNTVRRVHQAMESFIHNCNTIHSRGGNQVTFSSIKEALSISICT